MNFRAKFIIVLFSWESRSTTLFLFLSPFVFQVETLGFIRAVLFFTDRSGQSHENIFDILPSFDWSGDVLQVMLIRPFRHFGFVDFTFQVALVSDKNDDGVFGFDSAEIVPLFDCVFKGRFSGVVEDKDNAVASLEVSWYNGSVLLLSSGVPDVKFCKFVVEVDIFDFEIDGGDLGLLFSEEVAFGEAPEESSFTDIAITDKDKFVLFLLSIREVPLFNHEEGKCLGLIRFIIWFVSWSFIFYLVDLRTLFRIVYFIFYFLFRFNFWRYSIYKSH